MATNSTQYAVAFVIDAKARVSGAVNSARAGFRALRAQADLTSRALGFPRVAADARRFGDEVRGLGAPLGRLGGTVRGLAANVGVLGGGLAAFGVGSLVSGAVDRANEVSQVAERYGLLVGELQELRFAAERNGAAGQNMDDSLKDFNKSIGEAVNGTGAAKEIFDALNISLTDQQGRVRGTNAVMHDFADRMAEIEDQSVRLAVAQAVMGDNGALLVSMLAKGSDGLRSYAEDARKLGLVTEEQAAAARMLKDRQTDLGKAFDAVGNSIMNSLAPTLGPLLEFMKDLALSQREVIATEITGMVRGLSDGLRGLDFAAIVSGIRGFVQGVRETVQWVGGWGNAILIVAGIMHADLIVALVRATWALGVLGVSASVAAAKMAFLVGASMLGMIKSFFVAMQFGVGVMTALKIAIMANPIGFLVTAMAAAAGLIIAYWEPIKAWFADLDLFRPLRRRIAAFLGSLPSFVREAFNITDQDIATVAGRDPDGAGASPAARAAGTAGRGLGDVSGQVQDAFTVGAAVPPANDFTAPAAARAAASAPGLGGQAMVVVRFENAPEGMRVTQRTPAPGLALAVELNRGRSLAGAS